MRRIIATIIAACAIVAVAACGSTASTSSTQVTRTVTTQPAVAAPVQTAEQAGTGFYNVSTLQADVKSTYNTTPPVTVQDKSAVCVIDGQDAQCLMTLTTGDTVTEDVTINTAGDQWVAHGLQ